MGVHAGGQIDEDSPSNEWGRFMTRSYVNSERLARLVEQLSDRDLAILATLEKVRLASAAQLERLHFVGKSTQHRRRALLSLSNRRLVSRLDRVIGAPMQDRPATSTNSLTSVNVPSTVPVASRVVCRAPQVPPSSATPWPSRRSMSDSWSRPGQRRSSFWSSQPNRTAGGIFPDGVAGG